VKRVVDVLDLDDAVNAVFRRADEGCLYGDFQFAIDAQDDHFLRRGVLACYKPAEEVLRAVTDAGLAEVTVRLAPIASIKGD